MATWLGRHARNQYTRTNAGAAATTVYAVKTFTHSNHLYHAGDVFPTTGLSNYKIGKLLNLRVIRE